MTEINNLHLFEPITLAEMDSVALMNRFDTRYAFRSELLPVFLDKMQNDYRILEVNSHRVSRYESLYFDTADFNLYRHHHIGKLNRFKLRYRSYVESDKHFFEIKVKSNKNKTIKTRIAQASAETVLAGDVEKFIQRSGSIDPAMYEHKLQINFSRITFVNLNMPERVTIDTKLSFIGNNKTKTLDNLVIAEVKQAKPFVSKFVQIMKDHHVRVGGLSKYCYGIMNVYPELRYNNFKPDILLLNKLINDPVARS